jgi:UDP-N-acetylglucosamine 2-epimerase (non-hydrolysing)
MRIVLIAGTRPDLMKIAPLLRAIERSPGIETVLLHTGQTADWRMNGLIFRQLAIPEPDVNFGVDGGSLASQLAAVMMRFESMVTQMRPDCILVFGNVHRALACVLIAAKLHIKIIHVEAGLRSFNRTMPEEINRILTDSLSDLLFCSETCCLDNLRQEGVPESKMHLVGNVLVDTLLCYRQRAEASKILRALELNPGRYAVATIHHSSNTDDPATFSRILSALKIIGREMPVVFPIHPRTRAQLPAEVVCRHPEVRYIDPLGYLDFVKLMSSAGVVLTDSGGIQEETTVLNVQCLTLGKNTDRPCTVEMGSNRVVGTDPDRIIEAYRHCQNGGRKTAKVPPLWDGRASERIAKTIAASCC